MSAKTFIVLTALLISNLSHANELQSFIGEWKVDGCFTLEHNKPGLYLPTERRFTNLNIKSDGKGGLVGFHLHKDNTVEVKSFTTSAETITEIIPKSQKAITMTNLSAVKDGMVEVGIVSSYDGAISTELLQMKLLDADTLEYKRFGTGQGLQSKLKDIVTAFNWGCIYKK
jgi:hypothetical protein